MFLDCACGGGREEGGVGEGEGESRTGSRAFPGTGFLTPSASTPGKKSDRDHNCIYCSGLDTF